MNYSYKILLIVVSCSFLQLLNAQNLQKIDSLELSLKFAKESKNKIEILLNLSEELKNNDPDKALEYAKKANNFAEEINDDKEMLNSMIKMADIYWSLTDYKTAMKIGIESKEMAEEFGFIKELALSNLVIGIIYSNLGDYDKSSVCYFEALKFFEKINDTEGIGASLSNIGNIYYQQNNTEKALEYYFRSLNIAKETSDRVGLAQGLNNISLIYMSHEEYEDARRYIEEAIGINKELGNKKWEGSNYLNMGIIYLIQKNYDAALEYFQQALLIFENLKHTFFIVKCQINLGYYYLEINEIERSLEYATKSLETGKKHGIKKLVYNSAQLLNTIYLKKNDTLNAFKYDIVKYQMKDSLNLEEKVTELSKQELKYEFNKKEQEKKIEQQRKDYIYIIVIISLVFSIMVITLILLARQRMKAKNALFEKKQLENKIEYKNKELAVNVMSLIKKNEMLSDISDKLIQLKSEAVKDETKETLQKIARKLKKSTESEIWEEFELRFKQVHSDFYTKLLENFPDLSSGEQKLCAFLRLNMSTKEISDLTGQSVSAIEVARHRLRKKLGISNKEVNLVSFLTQV